MLSSLILYKDTSIWLCFHSLITTLEKYGKIIKLLCKAIQQLSSSSKLFASLYNATETRPAKQYNFFRS